MLRFAAMRKLTALLTLVLLVTVILAGCTTAEEVPPMTITLIADGRSQTYAQAEPITVGEFLQKLEIELGELDRVVPPDFTQLSDGMRITVRRVVLEEYCENRILPYQRQTVVNENVPPGEERNFQPGQNGEERVCYRVLIEDGVRGTPTQTGQPTLITAPRDEIVYVGPTTSLDPVDITGTIAYINAGNAWVIRGSSDTRRPLTTTGDIDPLRAFTLSPDGRQLLFTRTQPDVRDFNNQLWLVADVNNLQPEPVRLRPENILYADWVPNQPNTIAYSRAEPRPTSPGWGAYNDLWLMVIDPQTGNDIRIDPLIEEASSSGGPYSWWGRQYQWSPDGTRLAYIHADSVGLVDLQTGELSEPIVRYEVFTSRADWSWRTTVSWAPEGNLIATTTHGAPVGSEAPDRSPVFNVSIASITGSYSADVVEQAGIWSIPRFSPLVNRDGNTFPTGYLAYLQARQALNSITDAAEYDLIVADRDGSNARRIFPPDGQRGLLSRDYAWSPDGRQICVVYQGNLWIVDVESAVARQITLDGNASRPVWTN
jgi:Tol biopolymer transport system component